mgnify:CR=1 FL=1
MTTERRDDAEEARFSILAVCTGNICRSPAMERWLSAALGPESGVVVSSAGAHAVVGAGVEPTMARLIRERGGDPTGFTARQLALPHVQGADLVLTASLGHNAVVSRLSREAAARTFTIREFARLIGEVGPGLMPSAPDVPSRLANLVTVAAQRRAQLRFAGPDDDVLDPVGQAEGVYRRAADQIWAAVQAIAAIAADPGHAR